MNNIYLESYFVQPQLNYALETSARGFGSSLAVH